MTPENTGSKMWTGLIVGLVLGLVAGFFGTRYFIGEAPMTVAPPPRARTVEVELQLKEGMIVAHHAVYVNVALKDKVRWVSTDPALQNFTLRIEYKGAVPNVPAAPNRPENPFGKTGNEPAVWTVSGGRIELGPALPNTVGHEYKFIIETERFKYDPHIIFHDDGTRG